MSYVKSTPLRYSKFGSLFFSNAFPPGSGVLIRVKNSQVTEESKNSSVSPLGASLFAAWPWLWLLNMWEMLRGSVLFPDRLLHKLHGRGLAKSTICWISLSFSLPPSSSHLFSLPFLLSVVSFFSSLLYYKYDTKNPQPFSHCLQNKSFLLVRTESSVKASRHFFSFFPFFFLPSICYQRSLGILQSLVRGPAFFAISRMI